MTLIAVAVLAVIGLWLHTRTTNQIRDDFRRELSQVHDRQAKHLQSVIAQKNPDLEQLIALIDRQMQRIQAPQQAVVDHSIAAAAPSHPAVPFDDDEAFHQAHSMTVEELAEAAWNAEVTSGAA